MEKYYDLISTFCKYKKIDDEDMIQDLALEFCKAVKTYKTTTVSAPVESYLWGALRKAYKYNKIKKTKLEKREKDVKKEYQKKICIIYPDAWIEISDLLMSAKLTNSEHIIYVAKKTGLSISIIAHELDLPYTTVKSRFLSADKKIRYKYQSLKI